MAEALPRAMDAATGRAYFAAVLWRVTVAVVWLGGALGGVAGCRSASQGDQEPAAAAPASPPAPSDAIGAKLAVVSDAATIAGIDAAALRRHVEALASDANAGRATPSPGLAAAADYLVASFGTVGLEAPGAAPGYRQSFACGVSEAGLASNLVGVLRGRDPDVAHQFVIVSAHYDHIGIDDDEGDGIYNGANDNASGVAAMLEIARVFARARPRRSVAFVAFCGEETGLRGSKYWIEAPPLSIADTIAVVNLEMLGRPGVTPRRAWITGKSYSDLGATFDAAGVEIGFEFPDGADVGRTEGNLFERSDNWPFAAAGVVAHSVSAGVLDAYYHHVDDEPESLEYEAMAAVVGAIAWASWRIAEAETIPQWTRAGRERIGRE